MAFFSNLFVRVDRALAWFCLFAGGMTFLSAQSSRPCPAGVLQNPGGCVVTLTPGQSTSVSLAMEKGRMRMLTAEQLDGGVELRITPKTGAAYKDPFTNQAGLHARISVLIDSDDQITLTNTARDKPAKAILTAASELAADKNSELERAAEMAFAHAELLRIQDTHDQTAALDAYDEAISKWQSAGNQPQMARALIWKADFLVNNEGNATLAPPVMELAAPMLPKLDPIEAAHYWLIVAFMHVVQGDYAVVLDAYRRSLALYEAAGDTSHQAKVLDNSARVELMEGHSDVALTDEKRAAELAAAARDARREAFVHEELGAIYSTAGDSEAAYRAYSEALQALKRIPPEPRMEAAIWVDFSDLYITLGDLGRAQDSLDQAAAIWKTTNYPVGTVDTLNNYGDLYLLKGSPREARTYFERGLELGGSINYERGSIALMSGLGDSYLYEHDAVHAEEVLDSALIRAKKAQQTDSEMQIHCQLGDLALQKHDVHDALEQYGTCSKEAVAANDVYNQIRAEGGLARTALQRGALDDGQAHCEKALGMIEATRGELRNQDLKTSFFASQHSYYDLDIQILERLDHAHPEESYAWQAFLTAERARARTLLDQVINTDTNTAITPSLIAMYDDVQRKLRRLETVPHTRGAMSSESRRAAIERLTMLEQQLHGEIVTAVKTSDAAAPSNPLTLKSLQDSLPPQNAVLIEYWTGATASYAWTITRTGIRSFTLPPVSALTRQCAAYRRAVLSAVSSDPRLTAERRAVLQASQNTELRWRGLQLSKAVLPPGILTPGTTAVFVVGDGPIQSLAFASLPLSLGKPGQNVNFLSEPSATIFSILETHPATAHPMHVAVFADESVSPNGATDDVRLTSSSGRPQQVAPLPFAGDEAMMIRATMGNDATQLFPSAQVSRSTLQALNWNDFSIGHFAMHAVLNQQYAEMSGLALGQQRAGTAANFLWYGDVCHLHANLDLVVLSACNTALGEQVPGEGLRGLTQAFFAAGSQRVLGTLWQVDDQATSEWMRHFYQSLKASHSPVDALHDAQRSMAADPQWSAPYYWAGFVLSGDWRPLP